MVDQKYACLVNFPIRHAFEHVMLYTIFKLEPYPCSAEQGQGYQWSITLFSRTDTELLGKILHYNTE